MDQGTDVRSSWSASDTAGRIRTWPIVKGIKRGFAMSRRPPQDRMFRSLDAFAIAIKGLTQKERHIMNREFDVY